MTSTPSLTKHPTMAIQSVTIRPECKSRFMDWQAKLNAVIAGFEGFVSLEFTSSTDHPTSWVIVQRFSSDEGIALWKKSPEYLKLMSELRELTTENGFQEQTEREANLRTGVTEVIITEVQPENEKTYREWSAKIHQIEAKFQGFRGVYVQSPNQSQGRHWVTLLQFDTPQNLDRWLESPERQELLKKSSSLISNLESHRVASPYGGWFYSPKHTEVPSVWKQTMLILLALFPIVILEMKYLNPVTQGLNPSLSTFIGNAISVSLLAFPVMPIVIYLLSWWLFPNSTEHLKKTVLGTLFVFALYFIEVIAFWNFL